MNGDNNFEHFATEDAGPRLDLAGNVCIVLTNLNLASKGGEGNDSNRVRSHRQHCVQASPSNISSHGMYYTLTLTKKRQQSLS